MAIGLTTQDDRPAAEGMEHGRPQPAAGTVARVEHHLETPASDRAGVDDGKHAFQVRLIGIVERASPAERIPARPAKIATLPAIEQGRPLWLAQHHAGTLEELEAVVRGRDYATPRFECRRPPCGRAPAPRSSAWPSARPAMTSWPVAVTADSTAAMKTGAETRPS